jgi:hypothetical protein
MVVTVTAVVLVAGGVFVWRAAAANFSFFTLMMQSPQPEYSPLSRAQQDAIRNLLTEVGLDRDALIALNLSSNQAEAVLGEVRSWSLSNKSTLNSLQNDIDGQFAAVRNIENAIRMGPFDENHASSLATARSDLATAQQAYQNALNSLKSGVNEELSASQRTTWTAIQSGWGQQMPIRMLALTDEQRIAVSDAAHRFRRQRAAAASKEELDAAASTWNSALDQILTDEQEAVHDGYHSNYNSASAVIGQAITLVLPHEEAQAQGG